jgi:hypothetical protein
MDLTLWCDTLLTPNVNDAHQPKSGRKALLEIFAFSIWQSKDYWGGDANKIENKHSTYHVRKAVRIC